MRTYTLNRLLETVKADQDVLAVFLFGSAARNEASARSDIDVCLMMSKDNYARETLSQKRLDLLAKFDIDIQIFRQLPLYIRVRVIKEGKLLFCRDEDGLYKAAFRVIQEFADFEHIYRDYLKEVAGAG